MQTRAQIIAHILTKPCECGNKAFVVRRGEPICQRCFELEHNNRHREQLSRETCGKGDMMPVYRVMV
jgi:hypothetical protein